MLSTNCAKTEDKLNLILKLMLVSLKINYRFGRGIYVGQ